MTPGVLLALMGAAWGPPMHCEGVAQLAGWQAEPRRARLIHIPSGRAGVVVLRESAVAITVGVGEAGGWRLHDLPPDGDATEVLVLSPGAHALLLTGRESLTGTGQARLEVHCLRPSDPVLASAQGVAAAAHAIARSEVTVQTDQRQAALTEALERLGHGTTDTISPDFPWLRAAGLHAEAFVLARQNHTTAAARTYLLAATHWQRLHEPVPAAWATLRAAQQYRRAGWLTQAEQSLRDATPTSWAEARPDVQLALTEETCLLRRLRTDLEGATRCQAAIVALARRLRAPADLATSLANLADLEANGGALEDSRAHAQEALELAQASGARRARLLAHLVLGGIDRQQVRVEDALLNYAAARELAEALDDRRLLAQIGFQLTLTWEMLGEDTLAAAEAAQVRRWFEAVGDHPRALQAMLLVHSLGSAANAPLPRWLQGLLERLPPDDEVAIGVRLQAARQCLLSRDVAGAERLLAPLAAARGTAAGGYRQAWLLLRADLALARRRPGTAAALAAEARRIATGAPLQQLEAQLLIAEAQLRLQQLPAAVRGLEDALQQTLGLMRLSRYPLHRARLQEHARRGLAMLLSPRLEGRIADRTVLRNLATLEAIAPEQALGEITHATSPALIQLNRALQQHWLTGDRPLSTTAAASLAVWANQLLPASRPAALHAVEPRSGTVYLLARERNWHWWWPDADGTHTHRRRTVEPKALIQAAAPLVSLQALRRHAPPALRQAAQRLAEASGLMEAAGYARPRQGGSVLTLSAVAPLVDWPLSLLLPARGADGQPLATTLRVSVLEPTPAQHTPCCARQHLFIVADPQGKIRTPRSFPALPAARREAERLFAIWQRPDRAVTLALGEAASDAALLRALKDPAGIVYTAAHGLHSAQMAELNGLLVRSERSASLRVLGGMELAQHRLGAALVVLGSCSAAAATPVGPRSSTSLARQLIAAGVQRVIAPLWPTSDRAAAAFSEALFGALAQGALPPLALWQAQQRLRDDPRFSHPMHWAGWQLLEADPLVVDHSGVPATAP